MKPNRWPYSGIKKQPTKQQVAEWYIKNSNNKTEIPLTLLLTRIVDQFKETQLLKCQ